MRWAPVASALGVLLSAGAVASCGGDGEGSSDAGAAGAAMLGWFRASAEGDGDRACELLTDAAVKEIAEYSESEAEDCADLYAGASAPEEPARIPDEIVGPVGARDGFAIAVVRVGDIGPDSREENLLFRLREGGGIWRVDSTLPIPTPEDLAGDAESSDEAGEALAEYSQALAEGDADRACELLEPKARTELAATPKDCERFALFNSPDDDEGTNEFEDVLAVGDLALGYPGDSPPTVLVNTDAGWRVDPVSLGVP